MDSPRILVYAGKGSSHSWTWLADLFESEGMLDVRFLDSTEFVGEISKGPDEVIVSGGDGFSIASSLAGKGFSSLSDFVTGGGGYVGICAGAYLPLPSSVEPFSEFNLSSTRIENIDCKLGTLENVPPRVAIKYGRCAIVHPVRGELELGLDAESLNAPLYGGPIFKEPEEDEVLLRYRAFTSNTEFQIEKRDAATIVLGKPAAVRSRIGQGELLLLGPHLEHPRFREANELFIKLLRITPSAQKPMPRGKVDRALERALADLKVAILGLENRSFVVGKKLWDGGRYLELQAAIAKRARTLDRDLAKEISEDLKQARQSLLRLNVGIETDADDTTSLLVESARRCVDNYFQALRRSR
jgi:glutamine amidotransferase-like uncharacterized protein